MRKELLITVSALSLIASAGLGAAQEKGGPGGGPAGGSQAPGASQPAPAAQPGGGAERGERMQPSQSQQPRTEDPRANRAQSDQPGKGKEQNKQAQEQRGKPGSNQAQDRDMNRNEPRQSQDRANPDRDRQQQSQDRANPKRDNQTTGQGAAGRTGGASLTTEQRTKITTTIRQSNVRPLTNVNFNISVGTVVPRSVTLHPLPAAVIEVYPDWRPYRFVLVGDEILVIDPATHRIVAVLEA